MDAYHNDVRISFANDISNKYEIKACDSDPNAGNGRHKYLIQAKGENGIVDFSFHLNFHKGPLPQIPHNGILSNVLLEVMIDHLRSFQEGPFRSRETECAITHLEEALHWMAARADERNARNILGQHKA